LTEHSILLLFFALPLLFIDIFVDVLPGMRRLSAPARSGADFNGQKSESITMKKHSFLLILAASFVFCGLHDLLEAQTPVKYMRGTHAPAKSGNSRSPHNTIKIEKGDVVLGLSKDLVEKISDGEQKNLSVLSASMPRHNVRDIEAFFCDKTEVTNKQWKAYLDATDQEPSELLRTLTWKDGPDEGMSYPKGQENYCIRNIDLREARDFAAWCGRRIPTEEEWMRAAAGDDGRLYSWGDKWDPKLCKSRDRRTRADKLVAVGAYPAGASPFGNLDMTGGVWEWTITPFTAFDKFKPITIKVGRRKVTLDPRFSALEYVLKGGFYLGNDISNLLAVRQPTLPNTSFSTIGFRCVKSAQPGKDIFDAALKHLGSEYFKDLKYRPNWDKSNRYAVEITEVDTTQGVVLGFDHFLFAPVKGILTSISKIMKNGTQITDDGYFPLGILSVSCPLEEPNLPPGSYTLVYRHKATLKTTTEKTDEEEKPVATNDEKKKEKDKKGKKGKEDEEPEKTQEEIEKEEEEARIAEANRKDKEKADAEDARAAKALEKIGAITSAKDNINFPAHKNLILFLNPSDTIVGYVEVDQFKEGGEDPIRVVHVETSGSTEIEFTTLILGSKNPRFTLPIKIRNNPFK
jgi:formylglycine-generating enzyme required for sulfatase activity